MKSDLSESKSRDLVFGRHAVEQCLETNEGRLEKIWIKKGLHFSGSLKRLLNKARKNKVPVIYVEKNALDRLTNGGAHQGCVIRTSLVNSLSLNQWLKNQSDSDKLVLVLDGVQDPGNLGAIFRTAAAAGVDGIIFPKKETAPMGSTAMKTSAGTLQTVPAIKVTNLRAALVTLQNNGYYVIGLSEKTNRSIVDYDPPEKTAILVGSEGKGIRPVNFKQCDDILSIPLTGPAGSLNVSAAVAIILYEFTRHKI